MNTDEHFGYKWLPIFFARNSKKNDFSVRNFSPEIAKKSFGQGIAKKWLKTDSHLLLQEFPPKIWLNFAKWLQNHIGYFGGYKNVHVHVIVTKYEHHLSRLLV